MYELSINGTSCSKKIIAVSYEREPLEWHLKQEGIEFYGMSGLGGSIYRKKDVPTTVGTSYWLICKTDIIILN